MLQRTLRAGFIAPGGVALILKQVGKRQGICTTFNIFDNAIADIMLEPRWKAARDASLNLCDNCGRCEFMLACGGGYLPHRFSNQNGYDNPSVYCDDLIAMFNHMQSVLGRHVFISKPGGERVKISEVIANPH